MNNEQIIICNEIPKIGEIYWSTGVFDPIETLSTDSNTVIKKDRPVLVISKKHDNKNVRCVVLPLTSSSSCMFEGNKYKLPTRIDKDRDSYVVLNQPMTVSFQNLRTRLAVIVSNELMSDILKRFRSYFYLDETEDGDINSEYEIEAYNKQQEEEFKSNNPFFAQVANISKQLAENKEKERSTRNKHTSMTTQQNNNKSDSEFIPTPDDIITAKTVARTFIQKRGKKYDIVSGKTVLTLRYMLKEAKTRAQFTRDIGDITYTQCSSKLLPMMRDKLKEMGLDLYK